MRPACNAGFVTRAIVGSHTVADHKLALKQGRPPDATPFLRPFRRELSFLPSASGLWFIDDICFDLLTMTPNMGGDLTDPRMVR
jgi:hypothetical protein